MTLPHPLPDDLVELIARRFRAIAEPMRIKLLDRLRDGEATVGELSEAVGASQQNVSKHLVVLADAGILGRRKEGNHVYYRIVDEGVLALCEEVCGSVQQQLRSLNELVSGVSRVTVVDTPIRASAPDARAPGDRRPDRQAGPLGRRPRPRRRDRLGGPRRRARPLRAEGRERPLRGRLAGERLRVRPSTDAHPAELRRPLQLGADGRRPLAAAHHERRWLPPNGRSRRAGPARELPRRARSCHRTRARASPPTDTPRS